MIPAKVTLTRLPTHPSSHLESMSAAYARMAMSAVCSSDTSPPMASPNSSPKERCTMKDRSTPSTPSLNRSKSACSYASPRRSCSSPFTIVRWILVKKPTRSATARRRRPGGVELDAAQDGVEVDGLTGDDARRGGVDLGENLRDGVAIGGGGECLVDVADGARRADLEALILPREGGALPLTAVASMPATRVARASRMVGRSASPPSAGLRMTSPKRASGP